MSPDPVELPRAACRCLDDLARKRGDGAWRIVRELSNGQRNRCWLVDIADTRSVLRLGNPNDADLGVDRHREFTVHSAAAQAGLAPRIEYADPQRGILVTHFVNAAPCPADQLTHLVCGLRELHQLPLTVAVRDLGVHLGVYQARLQSKPGAVLNCVDSYRQRLASMFEEYRQMPVLVRLCHWDPIAQNTLLVDGRLLLIDWEYAAGGDPYFDLAVVVEDYRVPEQHISSVLALYDALAPQAERRLYLLRLWYRLLSLYWYALAAPEPHADEIGIQTRALDALLAGS